ncbi:protein TolQ [bacterium]|jgi:biopolymer transport protein TolQ|nr:protein TolQ [bacterium]
MPTPGIHPLAQANVLSLIAESGWVAKFVLLILFAFSVVCWAVILTKWRNFRLILSQNNTFQEIFWSGKSLDEILHKSHHLTHSPLLSVFRFGTKELQKASHFEGSHLSASERAEQFYRALIRASTQEVAQLESHLNWLATTASAAPFIGLFGTVWGIMNAFQGIGSAGSANLAVVAPGISEALITTATGIAAAIPAVIAYNYFTSQMRRVTTDLECFCQDFLALTQRTLHSSVRKGS